MTTAVCFTSKYFWHELKIFWGYIKTLHNRPKENEEYQININWEDNVGDEDATVHKEKDKNKVKTMALATAMATLGMGNMRGLEDPSLGPMLLSHA